MDIDKLQIYYNIIINILISPTTTLKKKYYPTNYTIIWTPIPYIGRNFIDLYLKVF